MLSCDGRKWCFYSGILQTTLRSLFISHWLQLRNSLKIKLHFWRSPHSARTVTSSIHRALVMRWQGAWVISAIRFRYTGESHAAAVDVMGSFQPVGQISALLLQVGKTSHVFPLSSFSFGVCFPSLPALPAPLSWPLWERKCVTFLVCLH